MILLAATLLLGLGAAYALWPLARHWQPRRTRHVYSDAAERDRADLQSLEDLELDVASGRLSQEEAARMRRQRRP